MQKYIIRCDRAGVFIAGIAERHGSEADLVDARRIHYWEGAASISQLAMEGAANRSACRISVPVPAMTVLGVIEIIPATDAAVQNLEGGPVWRV